MWGAQCLLEVQCLVRRRFWGGSGRPSMFKGTQKAKTQQKITTQRPDCVAISARRGVISTGVTRVHCSPCAATWTEMFHPCPTVMTHTTAALSETCISM